MKRKHHSTRLGLALGGGGARGGIHIGVLKALEEEGIPLHCITGTSIGAVIGALYALHPNAGAIEQRLLEYLESDTFGKTRFHFIKETSRDDTFGFFNRISSFIIKEFLLNIALTRPYLISRDQFRRNIAFFVGNGRLEDTMIPFAAVATDLETGEEVVVREGPLIDALYASCTYPGVVEPVRLEGRLLVDGGVVSLIPVEATRMLGAEVVIAVNVQGHLGKRIESISGLETVFRVDDIMEAALAHCRTRGVDILIHPSAGDTEWYDFEKAPEYIPVGEKATQERMPDILKTLKGRPWLRHLKAVRSAISKI